jgi:hypothetical protein
MTNLTYDDIDKESLEDLVKKYPKTNIESIKSLVGILEKNDKTINDAINAFNKQINKPVRDEIIYELSEQYEPSVSIPMITPAPAPLPAPAPTPTSKPAPLPAPAPTPRSKPTPAPAPFNIDNIFDNEYVDIDSVGDFIKDFTIDTSLEIILDDAKKANVYITSDLHGDYLRLLQHLINSKIIDNNIQKIIDDNKNKNYKKETILNETIIETFKNIIKNINWIKQDCVLILNGDIIESCSIPANCLSYDPYYNELFIHIIIYNLRILATENNSIVKIVMGNHDFNLFSKDSNEAYSGYIPNQFHPFKNDDTDTYEQYVLNRKILLSKFYNQSPLHILLKNTNGKTLATIVHGGIFDYNTSDPAKFDTNVTNSNGKLLPLDYLNKSNNEWHHVIKENNDNKDYHKYASTYFKHLWSRPFEMSTKRDLANYNNAVTELNNTHDYGDYLIFGHNVVAKENDNNLAEIIKDGKIIYVDMGVSTTKNSNKKTDFEILHINFTNEDSNKLEGISIMGKNRIITGGIIGGASKQCVYMIIIVILLLFLVCIIYRIIVSIEVPLIKDYQFD